MRIVIVVLIGLLLVSCQSAEKQAPKDPFFELPVTVTPRPAETDDTWATSGSSSAADGGQIFLEFTLQAGTDRIQAPSIVVDSANDAEVRVINEIAFVQDFDLEVADQAWIADPIIGVLAAGLTIEVTPARRPDGAVELRFRILCADVERPIRQKNALAGHGENALVTIELPALNLAEVAGTAILAPGVETSLATFPTYGGGEVKPLEVLVRATPLNDSSPQSATVVATRQALALSLVRLADIAPGEIRHLDVVAGTRVLRGDDTEVLKRFVLRADPDPSVEVRALRQVSFHQDYEVIVGSDGIGLSDPIIDTIVEGFTAAVKLTAGRPVLLWTFDRILSMPTFSTSLSSGGPVVTIDLPELAKWSGDLPLKAAVNVVGIAELSDGGILAAVVVLP